MLPATFKRLYYKEIGFFYDDFKKKEKVLPYKTI